MRESKRRRDFERQHPNRRLGDDPISAEYHSKMVAIAHSIDDFFNKGDDRKTGFVLMVFPFDDDPKGRCNYVSNAVDCRDIVNLMKEMIARF